MVSSLILPIYQSFISNTSMSTQPRTPPNTPYSTLPSILTTVSIPIDATRIAPAAGTIPTDLISLASSSLATICLIVTPITVPTGVITSTFIKISPVMVIIPFLSCSGDTKLTRALATSKTTLIFHTSYLPDKQKNPARIKNNLLSIG